MSESQSMFSFADPPEKKGRDKEPVELDTSKDAYVELAVDVPLRETFFYHVPLAMRKAMRAGVRVHVPFGGRQVVGYVLRAAPLDEVKELCDRGVKLRDVAKVLDETSLLDPILQATARWISER